MPGFLPDTSCMIAAVCAWHERHGPAAREIERRIDREEKMFVAAPSLMEAYAVLTRLPSPHRLSPADAFTLLEANFVGAAKTIALDGKSYQRLLRWAPAKRMAGGRIYDAVIVACALKAKAAALLTFNEDDFLPIAEKEIEIIVPERGSR